MFLPAAGNFNGTSYNNGGSNGNYWSSTLNSSTNGRNLNFNSGNVNPQNNNNRYNGFSVRAVRAVSALTTHRLYAENGRRTIFFFFYIMAYHLTREQLLADLHEAYYCARRNKRHKAYQWHFERRLERNLVSLRDELWQRSYRARPSTAFIITDPKQREVFAAAFRDRIVHHLYYNYTHQMLERTFIHDTYSCIERRGTHYGIDRLRRHIESESRGYQRRCWVLQMDIRGYFMHIDRRRLLAITTESLRRMARHRADGMDGKRWEERVDMDFVEWLTREIVMLDPTDRCHIHGSRRDWEGLPHDKSLYHTAPGCGLPIGNLTSQLFSNVYLNVLDQYMKRSLHCRHYGRYVDDFYVVSADREWLHSLIPQVKRFLAGKLALGVSDEKTRVSDASRGVEFLGAYLKPRRTYPSRGCLRRMLGKLDALQRLADEGTVERSGLAASLNSFLGVLSHYDCHDLRMRMFLDDHDFSAYGCFDTGLRHFLPGAG